MISHSLNPSIESLILDSVIRFFMCIVKSKYCKIYGDYHIRYSMRVIDDFF